jgi:MFS transporter, DHA3 family, tetracycline resistance protein
MKSPTRTKSILYSMEFSHGTRRALVGALGIVYFLSLGFNVVSITTLFAISTLVMIFFEFPTGAIADYDSRKKSLMIGFFLISLAFFGIFLFNNFWLLGLAWILQEIAWTFCSGAQSAWAIDALRIGKQKSKIVSLISKGYFFEKGGHIIGGLIGLIVISINFSLIWLFISFIYLSMFFVIWKYMEEKNFKPEKAPHNYLVKSLIKAKESLSFVIHKKNKQLRVLLAGDFLGILAISAFFIAMPLLFIQVLGIQPEKLSGIIALIGAIVILSPILAEKLVHKKGIKTSLILVIVIQSLFVILFGLSKETILAIIALSIIQFTGSMQSVVGDSAYQHEFDSKIRASLGSASNIIWAIGHSIAVFLAGLSINFFGVVPTIIGAGLLSLTEAIIYLGGLRKD